MIPPGTRVAGAATALVVGVALVVQLGATALVQWQPDEVLRATARPEPAVVAGPPPVGDVWYRPAPRQDEPVTGAPTPSPSPDARVADDDRPPVAQQPPLVPFDPVAGWNFQTGFQGWLTEHDQPDGPGEPGRDRPEGRPSWEWYGQGHEGRSLRARRKTTQDPGHLYSPPVVAASSGEVELAFWYRWARDGDADDLVRVRIARGGELLDLGELRRGGGTEDYVRFRAVVPVVAGDRLVVAVTTQHVAAADPDASCLAPTIPTRINEDWLSGPCDLGFVLDEVRIGLRADAG